MANNLLTLIIFSRSYHHHFIAFTQCQNTVYKVILLLIIFITIIHISFNFEFLYLEGVNYIIIIIKFMRNKGRFFKTIHKSAPL